MSVNVHLITWGTESHQPALPPRRVLRVLMQLLHALDVIKQLDVEDVMKVAVAADIEALVKEKALRERKTINGMLLRADIPPQNSGWQSCRDKPRSSSCFSASLKQRP